MKARDLNHISLTQRAIQHGGWLTSYPTTRDPENPAGDFRDDPTTAELAELARQERKAAA